LFSIYSPTATANERYASAVWDITSGKVLFSKNADERRYPASLTKMMTLYVLFEELEAGRFNTRTPLAVSARAAAQVPTKLGLKAGESIAVEDAIKALVTKSANDAAVVIAEAVSGSEASFAVRMTRTARELGMKSTQFRNASGLPDPRQYTTARDMMLLGAALQVRFPRYYAYFKTRAFTFRGRTIRGHNRLIGSLQGVDGIKTGYIRASGFNVVTSLRRGHRKLVAVVMGGRSARSRDEHMSALLTRNLPKAVARGGYAKTLLAAVGKKPVVVASADPTMVPVPPAPPRPALAEASAEAGSPASTGYAIQVGALPSEAAAKKVLGDIRRRYGSVLDGSEPITEAVEKDGASFVRARFGAFADIAAAKDACAALRQHDIACFALEM
jgi:D-alanyl-D-alanine carboxypeptidase